MGVEGWEATQIGSLGQFFSGGTPSKKESNYWGDEHPWVSGKDLKTHYLKTSIDKLTTAGFEVAHIAPKGASLVLVRGMTLHKDFPVGYATRDLAFNQDIKAIVPKENVEGLFLSYLLVGNKQKIRQLVSTAGHGTGRLDTESLKSYPVNLPSFIEQTKIAQILSTWDNAIKTTEQLIENSKAQKQALMQQLLTGEKRLPGFNGKWNYKTINQIAERIQKKNDGNKHPILTISSLKGFVTQEERYSRYMAGVSVKKYILLKKGEFAYNKGNSKTFQFGCIFDLETFNSGLVPHVYVCFKLNKGLSHKYFKYLFEADYLKPQLGRLVNTGVRNNGLLNIKPSEFMETKVPVPSFEEQERIADILHVANEKINNLKTQLANLKLEKKSLMQQLLTGKRRVKLDKTKETEAA